MTFESRITRRPLAHDPEAASETAVAFADLGPVLSGLLAATAGCSPFLRDLMLREADWLRPALQMEPELCFAQLLAACDDLAPDLLSPVLRQAKRRVALLVALADLGGVWTLEQATGALTAFADRAVQTSLGALVGEEIRRGKLPGATPDDAATAAGMVVLAMGKMGAQELNYSSDIDLICLFDESRYPGAAPEARSAFIRVTRRLAAVLSDSTQDGYVFRTDLRLRPDAAVTPVCLSMAVAERYYEAQGRTWERAAYIKARPCAGDLAAGERFLRTLIPFVWRKHLDFAAIQDAHDMRLRIRDHRNLHGPVQIEGHNLKLGQGGIREIEFFTQTRQLIAGGRDPALRSRTTTGALAALAEKGWLPHEVAQELTEHYRAHRELEHRLQMVRDAQTHVMPPTAEGVARIAHFCGEADVDAFRADLKQRLERVETLTGGFFAPSEAPSGPDLAPQTRAIVDGWVNYPALRSERAAVIFRRLRPVLLNSLARAANPDEALVALDGVIGGSFFAPWPGEAALAADLTRQLDAEPDYEKKLGTARRWMKEWHFRVGVHHLRGLIDADEAGASYADLAAATLRGLWPALRQQVARRYGEMPGRGAVVLGMGSLGAGRLNAASDLDLIMVYDAPDDALSTGPRPLDARAYYARLTQALVTALTAPMAEGRLYEVDMRLRPSGRQGPVATSFEGFCHYHRDEAWTWEHLALTRARVVVGGAELAHSVEQFRRALIAEKGRGARVIPDVAAMRARLLAAWPAPSDWEAKTGPGRLMDIEILAQTAALLAGDPRRGTDQQLRAGLKSGFLSQEEAGILLSAWRLSWTLRTAGRLLTDRDLGPQGLGQGGCAFLLRETGLGTAAALTGQLQAASEAAAAVIGAKLVGVQGNGETGDADDGR